MNVIFDADGTIYDFRESIEDVYRRILAKYSIQLPEGSLHERILGNWYKVCQKRGEKNKYTYNEVENFLFWKDFYSLVMSDFGYEFSEPAFLELWDYYAERESRHLSPGIKETLLELKKSGCRLGAVSNFDRRFYSLLFDHGLSDLFDFILSAVDLGYRKPADEYYLTLQRLYSLEPSKTLHVGNEPDYDYYPALKLGWHAIVYDPRNVHMQISEAWKIANFSHLPAIVAKLSSR